MGNPGHMHRALSLLISRAISNGIIRACVVGLLMAGLHSAGWAEEPASTKDTKDLEAALEMLRRVAKDGNQYFQATAEEMDKAMRADSANAKAGPLQFPKGNGIRMLMTGHSFVAPAVRTLPALAAAAGFDGHHQRAHTSGGSTGSANAIWLTEFGKFRDKPAAPILMPAIATGQWDVMTWGAYYNDTEQCYTPWIDVCLAKNPKMTFFIQDGWPQLPRDDTAEQAASSLPLLETELAIGDKMLFRPLYDGLNKRYPSKVHIIPVAPAVMEMIRHYFAGELPGFDCLSEHLGGKHGIYKDGGHLSSASGMDQIVGYTYFGVLYRQSPERITAYHPKGVDATVDRLMRKAAWNAVTHSPYTGITDKNGKGVAD
jgi:hypothetical protein